MNNTITNAGGTGKIGDREVFKVGSTVYEVVEAQVGPAGNYYDTWRLFLVSKTTNTAQQLNPVLAGGAKSLGNPTLTFVTLPNGKPALVFTYFIFSVNKIPAGKEELPRQAEMLNLIQFKAPKH